jgi:hypothetical protein
MTSNTLYRVAMTADIMFFIVLATIAYGFFPLTPIRKAERQIAEKNFQTLPRSPRAQH